MKYEGLLTKALSLTLCDEEDGEKYVTACKAIFCNNNSLDIYVLFQEYRQGLTAKFIAEKLGMDTTTIYRILNRFKRTGVIYNGGLEAKHRFAAKAGPASIEWRLNDAL